MASITAGTLKDTLIAQTYPYTIRFYTYEPKFPIYPYAVVKKIKPQGTDETITEITKREAFEVTLYIRYTRHQEKEQEDQTTVEDAILEAMEGQDYGTNALFSESKQWQRMPLQQFYGSMSRITVNVVDKASKSGSGILGYTDKIELNSSGSAIQIQCLSFSESRGSSVDSHLNDAGQSFWDATSSEVHQITFTYEATTALDTVINTLADARVESDGKLLRGGVTTKYKFLVGNTTKAGQFDNIERATTVLYVTGIWV